MTVDDATLDLMEASIIRWFNANAHRGDMGMSLAECRELASRLVEMLPVPEISQTEIRIVARTEWAANHDLGYVKPDTPWDIELWLNHLAARTEYIIRQLPGVRVSTDYDAEAQAEHRKAYSTERKQT